MEKYKNVPNHKQAIEFGKKQIITTKQIETTATSRSDQRCKRWLGFLSLKSWDPTCPKRRL